MALVIEKILQHTIVSVAFYSNWGDIRSTVAVDPGLLMVLGALVALLFALSHGEWSFDERGQRTCLSPCLYSTSWANSWLKEGPPSQSPCRS